MSLETLLASPAAPFVAHRMRWAATMPWNPKCPVAMDSWGTDRLQGNHHRDETDCVDLLTLLELVPENGPWAFYLDSRETGIVVADIEPDCPEGIREAFLATPWLYGEVSVSGQGLHLLFRTADLAEQFVGDAERLRSQDHTYEFLQRHWVTFTGRSIGRVPGDDLDGLKALYGGCPEVLGRESWGPSPDEVALAQARRGPRRTLTGDAGSLQEYLMRLEYRRDPASFGGDMSTYEWNRMRWLLHRIRDSREYDSLGRAEMLEVAVEVARRTFPDAEEREMRKSRSRRQDWYVYLAESAARDIL